MRWFEVNDTSEALTIVLDFENSKALRGELGNEFKAKEYSYIAAIDEQRPLDAERVCRYFTDEMDAGRLYRMGRNKKFVFLFYMDYTKLCQGWLMKCQSLRSKWRGGLVRLRRIACYFFILSDMTE